MQTKKMPKKRAKKPARLGKLLAMLPVSCILLYPLYLAAQLDICEETYVSSKLPPAFSGIRVAFVSDIHYGEYLSKERVKELVRRVNALQADILILGGDYGQDSAGAIEFLN